MHLALRFMRRQPGFTLAVILTLALGIGATSSVYSVLNALVLRPLAYRDADRLAIVWETNPALGMPTPGARVQASVQNYLEWLDANGPLEELAAFADRDFNLTGVDLPEPVRGFRATANLFPLLGVRAQLGRLFLPEEDAPGRNRVVLLSDTFWRRRFGAGGDILGRRLLLDGEPHEVVGVLPPRFEEPPRWSGYQKRPDVWVPMAFTAEERTSGTNHNRILYPIARLKPGRGIDQAHNEMAALGDELARRFPHRNQGWSINLIPLQAERVSGRVYQSLIILLLAAAMVLIIASINVGHLLLARASGRQKEFAIRASLGASRLRILRQLLAEAAVFGILGGILGVLISYWTTPILLALQSGMIRRVEEVTVDGRVLLFAALVTLTSVLVCGLAPLRLAQPERLRPALTHRPRMLLLFSEAALTVVLLTASALLVKSLHKMMDVDLGLRIDRVLSVAIAAKDAKFFDQLVPRIQALPAVDSVGVASHLPMQALMGGRVRTIGMANKDAMGADFRWVDAGYFPTLSIPMLQGRNFTASEVLQGNARVAIVDATLAKRLHPSGDVVGMNVFSVDWPYCSESCRIVGVSGAIRQIGPEEPARPEILLPGRWPSGSLIVRTRGDASALGPLIRKAVAELDRQQPVGRMEWMAESFAGTTEERRFNLTLTGVFTALALTLAGVGIFAVTAFSVSQRAREFAIRAAVGATPRQLIHAVLRQSLPGLLAGGALGLMLSAFLMTSLRRYLYNVEPVDWTAYAVAAAILLTVAAAALFVPVRRALRIDPATALRRD
ncbi:MAG: ABC transporter permease [Bryobacterales bacterium]|nr:ABC transporter permease [Bryobacterales bacterium]